MTPNNNVFKLACEPIQNVRIGIIGIGNRGLRAIRRYAFIQGAQITAVADLYEDNVSAAEEEISKTNPPCHKKISWRRRLERNVRLQRNRPCLYLYPMEHTRRNGLPRHDVRKTRCRGSAGRHDRRRLPQTCRNGRTDAPALLHARELLLRRIRPHYNETCNRRHVRHYHTRRRSIHTRCNVRHRCKQDTNLQPRTMER